MQQPREHLVAWLRDAHAMEEQAIEILEKQANRLESYPDMQRRIRQHIDETKRQAERVNECINRIGDGTSTAKDLTGKLMGNISAMTNAMASDEVVKNAIADLAFENFEIASYTSLIAAAEAAGDEQTAQVCREILQEEEEMAAWVKENLPQVTRTYMERDLADVQAKR